MHLLSGQAALRHDATKLAVLPDHIKQLTIAPTTNKTFRRYDDYEVSALLEHLGPLFMVLSGELPFDFMDLCILRYDINYLYAM
jgi:hypothetical protein